jgi:hypothetical protein
MNTLCTAGRCALVVASLSLVAPAPATAKDKRIVTVTAKEAKAKGLWPLGLTLNITDTSLSSSRFPQKGVYLTMSGPPGGPLGIRVRKVALHKVTGPFKAEPGLTWSSDKKELIMVGKRKRVAFAFTRGKSLARSHGCNVHLSAPKVAGKLLLTFYIGAGKSKHPGCKALGQLKPFNTVLPSVRLLKK